MNIEQFKNNLKTIIDAINDFNNKNRNPNYFDLIKKDDQIRFFINSENSTHYSVFLNLVDLEVFWIDDKHYKAQIFNDGYSSIEDVKSFLIKNKSYRYKISNHSKAGRIILISNDVYDKTIKNNIDKYLKIAFNNKETKKITTYDAIDNNSTLCLLYDTIYKIYDEKELLLKEFERINSAINIENF